MRLFLDVETTGLVRNGQQWDKDYAHFPRIVSIAWKFEGDRKYDYFILNQEGKDIPAGAARIHGITNEVAAKSPWTFRDVLPWLIEDALQATQIVGHNLYFDTSVIKANTLSTFGVQSKESKLAIQALDKMKRFDIMRASASFNKGYITLHALHKKLFNNEYHAHSAYQDVFAVERCFNELLKREIIKPYIKNGTTKHGQTA